jgi:hypothetical protein
MPKHNYLVTFGKNHPYQVGCRVVEGLLYGLIDVINWL